MTTDRSSDAPAAPAPRAEAAQAMAATAALDPASAVARLREAPIPRPILAVIERLRAAGHEAVLVGGAVRDALLARGRGDWDVASSATPDEVMAAFPKVIPTGVAHGTVTVVVGRGDARAHVEVTTFRGEGTYEDGRRPSSVTFLRDLEADLARRDFTVNALAWDPLGERFSDPFGGLADLRAGVIRAVGAPAARFGEDGLRTMRAVRFCAALGFGLEPATEAAIPGALDVFDRVSRERVQVELVKLLGARDVARGLEPMARTGLWERVLAPLAPAVQVAAIADVVAMPSSPWPRLARLLRDADADAAARALDGLKPSRDARADVLAWIGVAARALVAAVDPGADAAGGPAAVRRAVAQLGAGRVDGALDVWGVDAPARGVVRAALAGAVFDAKGLALTGQALLAAGYVARGPEVGELQRALLEYVLDDPARNDEAQLRAFASAWVASRRDASAR